LDLTRVQSGNTQGTTNQGTEAPLLPYQKLIIAHGIFCFVGFLVFLPAGALIARYFRSFTPTWFTKHWVSQVVLGKVFAKTCYRRSFSRQNLLKPGLQS